MLEVAGRPNESADGGEETSGGTGVAEEELLLVFRRL
jgi:hypothetical protein